jgi:hypothetical protein
MNKLDSEIIADLFVAADTDDGYESLTLLLRGLREHWPEFAWNDLVSKRHENPHRWGHGGKSGV